MAIWEEVTCKRCRQKVHINNVKCSADGELICIPCLDKSKAAQSTDAAKPVKQVHRINYQCLRCRYRFSLSKDSRVALRCPYCNSENVAPLAKDAAKDIIKESTNDLYDY